MNYFQWYLCVSLHGLLLARMAQQGLLSRYPLLGAFLAGSLARSLCLIGIGDFTRMSYLWAWLLSEPLLWGLRIGVAVEIYRALAAHYPGIERVSKPLIIATSIASGLVSLLPIFYEQQFVASADQWIFRVKFVEFIATRFIAFGIAFFLITLIGLQRLHREQPVRANVLVYALCSTAMFGADAAQYLVAVAGYPAMASIIFTPVTSFCLVMWIGLLRRSGERVAVFPADPLMREYSDRLNEATLRALRNVRT